jgi:hypothetical protein
VPIVILYASKSFAEHSYGNCPTPSGGAGLFCSLMNHRATLIAVLRIWEPGNVISPQFLGLSNSWSQGRCVWSPCAVIVTMSLIRTIGDLELAILQPERDCVTCGIERFSPSGNARLAEGHRRRQNIPPSFSARLPAESDQTPPRRRILSRRIACDSPFKDCPAGFARPSRCQALIHYLKRARP